MTSTGNGVRGNVTAISACVIGFQVPAKEISIRHEERMHQSWCTIEMRLTVDRVPEVPDLPIGDWIYKITLIVVWPYLSRKTMTLGGPTEMIPPKGLMASQTDVVHFTVTGALFKDKGSAGYGDPDSPWISRSDGIQPKTIAATEEIFQVQKNRSAWTYIIAPSEIIEVELMFPVGSKNIIKEPSLPVQLWDGYARNVHADCVLVSRDGKRFPCHRFILTARSPVFAAMFQHDMQEKHSGVCKMDGISGNALEILLEFLYTDRADAERIKDVAVEVYKAADMYGVEGLCAACENILIDNLSAKTALSYLNFAVSRGLDGLKLRAIKFLHENAAQI